MHLTHNVYVNDRSGETRDLGTSVACVYALVDPRDGEKFYVGVTSDSARRYRQHTGGHASKRPSGQRVLAIKAAGMTPDMLILEVILDYVKQSPAVVEIERKWIETLTPSTNICHAPVGSKHSKDSAGKKLYAELRQLRAQLANCTCCKRND